MGMTPLNDYKIGLVLSQAGFNAAQLADMKARLKMIAKAGGAEPDGIKLCIPVRQRDYRFEFGVCREATHQLAEIVYVRIEIVGVERIGRGEPLTFFDAHDEVWCVPSERQSVSTNSRPWAIYDAGRLSRTPGKYKLIPPWVEQPVSEAKETKPKPRALKG